MEDILRGAFISGIGIDSELLVIDITNNELDKSYRIWICGLLDCDIQQKFNEKGLSDSEISLLTINQLRHEVIGKAELNEIEDLIITFESGIRIIIRGSDPDPSCYEPWRLMETSPESKFIRIVCNK